MSELINLILNKPDWASKINDHDIVQTWTKEAVSQNINPSVLKCVLELLKDYKNKKDIDYDGDDEYDWAVTLGVDLREDLGIICECSCLFCEDGYNTGESDDYDSEENDDDWKKRKQIVCLCTEELRLSRFDTFLNNFVFREQLNDTVIQGALKGHVGRLESQFTEIDYHPGSNNQVVDLVHPSLFCYVRDVTPLLSGGAVPCPTTDALFQWLPAEFTVHRTAENAIDRVSIDSYINNLPRAENEALYDSIGTVFGRMVPLFDRVLQALHDSSRLVCPTAASAPIALSHCQVIVKLANIVVAPGEIFPGGHWHLEGMPAERIVATGIYYYDMTNLQDNALEFRSTLADVTDIDYPQNGSSAVHRHYGMVEMDREGGYDRQMESTIDLGSTPTHEDLLLVFPNFLQHKVSEVRLEDPSLPGTRKILCFFLVNPYDQVVSTAHVAPQQRLLAEQMTCATTPATSAAASASASNSASASAEVLNHAPPLGMSLEDAKLYRELLMFQRKYQIDDQTRFFERGWSLCEH